MNGVYLFFGERNSHETNTPLTELLFRSVTKALSVFGREIIFREVFFVMHRFVFYSDV